MQLRDITSSSFLGLILVSFLALIIMQANGESLPSEPPDDNKQTSASKQATTETAISDLSKNSDNKSVSQVKRLDSVRLLLDEIRHLKLDTKSGEPKRIMPISNEKQTASGQTVCDKSLAVGTLGYRVLCDKSRLVVATAAAAAAATAATAAQNQEKQQKAQSREQRLTAASAQQPPSQAEMVPVGISKAAGSGPDRLGGGGGGGASLEPVVDAGEITRLQGLLERINKRGEFRSVVSS